MKWICPKCGEEMAQTYAHWHKEKRYTEYCVRCEPCHITGSFNVMVKGIEEWFQ